MIPATKENFVITNEFNERYLNIDSEVMCPPPKFLYKNELKWKPHGHTWNWLCINRLIWNLSWNLICAHWMLKWLKDDRKKYQINDVNLSVRVFFGIPAFESQDRRQQMSTVQTHKTIEPTEQQVCWMAQLQNCPCSIKPSSWRRKDQIRPFYDELKKINYQHFPK